MHAILRPLTDDDVDAARTVQYDAFADHDRRFGDPVAPLTAERIDRQQRRIRHFLQHDPAGAWAAELDGRVVGVALASVRGRLWGLSLFVVDVGLQGQGIGRRLLDAALGHGEPGCPGVILSSRDPRALRRYAAAGFDLHPQVKGTAVASAVRPPLASPRVRDGGPDDYPLADDIDVAVRSFQRGPDHHMLGATNQMLVVDDRQGRGYAYRLRGNVSAITATDDETAGDLLRTCLARAAEEGEDVVVEHLNSAQQWAIRIAVEAGLTLAPSGPVFWRGMAPPAAYLPSGPYL